MTEAFDDKRLDELVDLIVQLASGNLSARLAPSDARDSVDAVITGINLLAEELDLMYKTLEHRVAERTADLDQARRDMERLALNDALTGLANRTLLADRIGQAIVRSERGERPPCLLLLDLDEFKTINDGLGHGAGDGVLVDVARRLTSVVRNTDTVARLGGDEFAILMPGTTEEAALRIAQRALAELQKPYSVGDRAVWAGASIGVCFGQRGQTADLLLRDADTAMYAAKARGRGNVQVFRAEMHHAAQERLQVGSELGVAVAQGQLRLHYQPIVELATGRIVAVEALVRWMHPQRGLLRPVDFMPVAEDSGHIVELGHWVLQTAIGQLSAWAETMPDQIEVHVNLSPVEVRWPGLTEFISATLEQHGVAPDRLALEVSETGLMTGDIAGLEALRTLRDVGVGIEIDDFGTGYSSISYLRRLPIDTVKIDQSLIGEFASDADQVTFVGAMLRLIDSLGLRTVAEGIETATQMEQLLALGCIRGQGTLFSEPLSASDMTRLLSSRPVTASSP
jgi:diguanylate cyclase (GGDEF)-like protein